jgi:hypothetical protein
MRLRRGYSRYVNEVDVDDGMLVRRLRELRWPAPPAGVRERGWAVVQERLKLEKERRAARLDEDYAVGEDDAGDADYVPQQRARAG